MLETHRIRSDAPSGEGQSDSENSDEKRGEKRESPPKDPTRYGDWEVGGRCIDF